MWTERTTMTKENKKQTQDLHQKQPVSFEQRLHKVARK